MYKKFQGVILKIVSNVVFLVVITSISQCCCGKIYQPVMDDNMKESIEKIKNAKKITGGVLVHEVFEVEFIELDEFIVLSPSIVKNILHIIEDSYTSFYMINFEKLMNWSYINYIINIINGNRDHKMFRYSYLNNSEVSATDIFIIIEKQLSFLALNGIRYFSKVCLEVPLTSKVPFFSFSINEQICKLIKNERKSLIIKSYNCIN